MRNLLFTCLLACIATVQTHAQHSAAFASTSTATISTNGATPDIEESSPQIEEQLDGLGQSFNFPNPSSSLYDTLLLNTHDFSAHDIPSYTAEVTQTRMYELPTVIQMDYNVYVQYYIDVYAVKKRDLTSKMLGLKRVYFPLFEEQLDRMGMPMELKYLAVVESALNPHARSRVGATGLWQFMLSTGKLYGLKVNSYVDERKDPYKSTVAALKYLKNAYEEFGDWHLAIASYNCGAGNVRKAIRRSGGKKNFWAIRRYLPRETRGYVPAFLAATYVFEYASEHNIYPMYVDFDLNQDTLHIRNMDITLKELSDFTRSDINALKSLNPELKLDRIPYSSKTYVLRVPTEVAEFYAANQQAVYAKFGKKRVTAPPVVDQSYDRYNGYPPRSGAKLVYHTVRSGEVVGAIAERYGVSARQVSAWNNLRRYRIRVGQRLKIYTTKKGSSSSSRTSSASTTSTNVKGGSYHTVRSGDTLWEIAKRYGTSVEKIKRLNSGMSSKLKIGQKIRIK
ncbi:transglycosylase SLT domain-containing protein [Pontibacter sp. G13]|uniref:lytic transglycosylase domain-containing protein n=1 Tax=Pontibacter sp. G13 TaxID=3074898 RepID=UPI0028895E87|nr:transglycosylase SLT domain-containing protein [Pontibacter sp. G13]WNJ19947.1 transglycosylase SLT domain-containing protein [Pontibacter sp. G13]